MDILTEIIKKIYRKEVDKNLFGYDIILLEIDKGVRDIMAKKEKKLNVKRCSEKKQVVEDV